jgi:hypothetical protein
MNINSILDLDGSDQEINPLSADKLLVKWSNETGHFVKSVNYLDEMSYESREENKVKILYRRFQTGCGGLGAHTTGIQGQNLVIKQG